MNMRDKIRFTARYYTSLQGLIMIPPGIFILTLGLLRLSGLSQPGDCSFGLVAFLPMIVITIWLARYYRSRYGSVSLDRAVRPKMLVFQVVTFGVFLSYLFMSSIDLYILDDIPVVLTLLLIGIWFALIPLFSEGQRQYYFIIGAAIIAAALLPATGLMTKAQVIGVENSGAHVVFSLGWVLGGLLDHWLLVRLFHELQETNYETAV